MGAVNVEKIQRADGLMLGATLLKTIEKYFENPVHQEEFERWQKERKEKARRFPA